MERLNTEKLVDVLTGASEIKKQGMPHEQLQIKASGVELADEA